MTKFAIRPGQTGYTVQASGPISARLNGPASRRRKDVERTPIAVGVQIISDEYGFQYSRSFYRIFKRAMPFTIDLIFENQDVKEYTAFFQPGGYKLVSMKGQRFVVGLSIEVMQQPVNDDFDMSAFAVSQAGIDLNLLSEIVNVDWPLA